MADNSKIEWTEATWNVITGCSVVSAGCKHCYAMKLAGTRLQHHPSRAGLTQETSAGPVWTGEVRFNEDWLKQPLLWKRPRRIFVCAHSDLFHEAVPDEWIDCVFAVMALAKQHTFQVLTKRPKRMLEYLRRLGRSAKILDMAARSVGYTLEFNGEYMVTWPIPNIWLGVSVENQEAADVRIPLLLQVPAAVRWVSAEPLLGPLNIERWLPAKIINWPGEQTLYGLDWCVAGGESGPKARSMHTAWARSLGDQCAATGVAFHFKQWGEWLPAGQDGNPDCDWQEINASNEPVKVGKKAAGRLLDGVLHDEYPGART